MPKVDPKTLVNPIRAKLANDIAGVMKKDSSTPAANPVKIVDIGKGRTAPKAPISMQRARLSKPKKVLFTREEQEENDLLVSKIAKMTGADTLGWSHVSRAMWSLLRRAEDQVDKHMATAPQLTRPSNGDPIGLAQFEDSLANFLLTLLKDTPR